MSIHHPEIVVTSRIPPFLTTGLQERYVVHERDHIRDRQVFGRVRALVGGGESKIDASYMALFPALEMISVCGVGYDGIDVAAAKKRGIMVTHTPDVLNDDVADLALGLLLSVARKIPAADRFTRNADWLDGPFQLTRKLTGAKLGIVGMGRIGQAIAKRAGAARLRAQAASQSSKSQQVAAQPHPIFRELPAMSRPAPERNRFHRAKPTLSCRHGRRWPSLLNAYLSPQIHRACG